MAWARIPSDSPFWVQATEARANLKIDRGLLADAEALIKVAQKDAPDQGAVLNALLATIYQREGRIEEALRSIEEEWDDFDQKGRGASENAVHLVRFHMDLMRALAQPKTPRAYFEEAARMAPRRRSRLAWQGRSGDSRRCV